MKLKRLTPILYTADLPASLDFYTRLLGFTVIGQDMDWGYARVALDEVDIMLSLPNALLKFEKPCFTGSLYIETDGVDAWWEKLRGQCEVCYPPENFEYGMREFAVYDNNRYIVQFGEEISG